MSAGGVTAGAILLAGGRASRMGGVAKPLLDIGGRSMLQRAIDACRGAGCAPITVVAPEPDGTVDAAGVRWTREDPPFGGPAAGVVAALETWDAAPEWAFVLACDLPGVEAAVAQLHRDVVLVPADTDGMCLADAASRPQWLIGVYRTEALHIAARALPDRGRNASMRALLDDLAIAVVPASPDLTDDVDTLDDLERFRRGV